MSTDLEQAPPRDVVDPFTGELIPRTDVEKATLLVRKIRDQEEAFKKIKAWATAAFAEQCDARADWTVQFGGFKVSIDPPTATDLEWDIEELKKLKPILGDDRFKELVHEIIDYKPQTAELKRAAKAGGEVQAIIERAQKRTPKTRYLKFS